MNVADLDTGAVLELIVLARAVLQKKGTLA